MIGHAMMRLIQLTLASLLREVRYLTSQTSLKSIIHYDIFPEVSVADDTYTAGLYDG